ncbi:MAG: hypothetical protein E7326_07715 [Clostridiales bacterium]|nr:hypothetical protein [Clostridiales bacterium]
MRGCTCGRRFFSTGGGTVTEAQSLRKQYLRLTDRAAQNGIADPENLWDLTPNEISRRMKSCRALYTLQDRMALIAARYIMLAVHCPDKLPQEPVFFPPEGEDMEPHEIKAQLRRMKGAACF